MKHISLSLLDNLSPVIKTTELKKVEILQLWKDFMIGYDIEAVNKYSFHHYDNGLDYFFGKGVVFADNRTMEVIASVLSWLPSNCGKAFLHDADHLSLILGSKDKGYLYKWADENRRRLGYNSGVTVVEYLLTPIEYHDFQSGLKCKVNQYVSIADLECINHFIDWLSEADGQEFLMLARKVSIL